MEPLTRVQMQGGFFYDLKGKIDTHPMLLTATSRPGSMHDLRTAYGQVVWINPNYIVAIRDLTTEPRVLASAWRTIEASKEND